MPHQDNIHKDGYDLIQLISAVPALKSAIVKNKIGELSINFSDKKSVRLLNTALLKSDYGVDFWAFPKENLCPPIPGRADYIHVLNDLLQPKSDQSIKGLDIGTGASLIYPILGKQICNWQMVGTDISIDSIQSAKSIIDKNEVLKGIKVRRQKRKFQIFDGIVAKQERFDFTMCNPPFYTSAEEALKANLRKQKNLGLKQGQRNFSGVSDELYCEGGELAFITKMIDESKRFQTQIKWFTTLVSKKENLEKLEAKLQKNPHIKKVEVVDMSQGQKQSRVLAWTYRK
jgi:23S rRNA (adenine1618-N6)-methyltransferase